MESFAPGSFKLGLAPKRPARSGSGSASVPRALSQVLAFKKPWEREREEKAVKSIPSAKEKGKAREKWVLVDVRPVSINGKGKEGGILG